jgi:uncharacterized protein involved in oxidation of intracellular sulfur
MKVLFIINDAPYGSEKVYNALRLAIALLKEHADVKIRIFLMGDAVMGALPDQQTPTGYYNLETMLKLVINKGAEVKACGTCSNSRGISKLSLISGIEISTMSQLAQWVKEADKIIPF